MKQIEIEKLNQLVSRTDMTGNEKVDWLISFIDKREHQLHIPDVSNSYSKQELLNIANILANDIFNDINNLKYKGNLELTLQDRLNKICNHNYC